MMHVVNYFPVSWPRGGTQTCVNAHLSIHVKEHVHTRIKQKNINISRPFWSRICNFCPTLFDTDGYVPLEKERRHQCLHPTCKLSFQNWMVESTFWNKWRICCCCCCCCSYRNVFLQLLNFVIVEPNAYVKWNAVCQKCSANCIQMANKYWNSMWYGCLQSKTKSNAQLSCLEQMWKTPDQIVKTAKCATPKCKERNVMECQNRNRMPTQTYLKLMAIAVLTKF